MIAMDAYVNIVSQLPEVQAVHNIEQCLQKYNKIVCDLQEHFGILARKGDKLFQFFALYMPEFSSKELHKQMVSFVEFHKGWFTEKGRHLLARKQITVDEWLSKMKYARTPGDELCILALSKMMGEHTCVWLSNSLWTTSENQCLSDCIVHLVYIGSNKFMLT